MPIYLSYICGIDKDLHNISSLTNYYKKIAFGDNSKMRFSVVRKVFYTFLHHEKSQFQNPNTTK